MSEYFGKDLEAMSFANNYHRWILSEFLPYLGNSVAEVGAGVGSFSSLILETDISRLVAFEPSYNMFPVLQKTLLADSRARAINGFFRKEETDEYFDSVLYVNVLEHIEDDAFELSKVRDSIVPGGHLMIFVPALPLLYSEFDKRVGHFRRYLRKNIIRLVERAGFSIIKAHYFDAAGVIPWYINFTLFRNSMSGQSISLYDRWVVPPMRKIERLIPPPIGKNLLLISKKP